MKLSNTVRLNKNGKLTVMQVSDPQDMVYVRPAMVKMLDAAYDKVKPDLVLFTGDNILGNHLLDARIGNRKVAEGWQEEYTRMEKSLEHILNPLEIKLQKHTRYTIQRSRRKKQIYHQTYFSSCS